MKIKFKPTSRQYQVWKLLMDKSTRSILYGGSAGGGKSWLLAEYCHYMCYVYPGIHIGLCRSELKRIKETTLQTFFKVARHHKIPETDYKLNGVDNYIKYKNGSKITLIDLADKPSDPNFDKLGSLELTLAVIDEVAEISFGAYEMISTRIGRHMNKEYNLMPKLLMSCNPAKNWLFFEYYKPWEDKTLPEDKAFVPALPTDNPYLDENYIKGLHLLKDTVKKQRLLYGNWNYESNPNALFTYKEILAMFEEKEHTTYKGAISADVARFGQDKAVIAVWEGYKIVEWHIAFKCELVELSNKIKELADRRGIARSNIVIDESGLGSGVVDMIRGCKGFVGGSSPIKDKRDPQHFNNLRTQSFFKLQAMQEDIEITLDNIYIFGSDQLNMSEMDLRETLLEELAIIQTAETDSDQKKKLLSKDKMKEKLTRSPDFVDTISMRFLLELKPSAVLKPFRLPY